MNPADSQQIVLRYEPNGDGLLYSTDGGRAFKLMCGSSVSDPSSDAGAVSKLGPIAVTGGGKVLMGTFYGLWVDDGKGCGWSRASGLLDRWVSDIVPHPSEPGVAFLITSNGGDAINGITRRNPDGTLTELGTREQLMISRLRLTELPGGGLRFYQSVLLGQLPIITDAGTMSTTPNYGIRVSDDEGATWRVHALGAFDGTMRLEAIDPSNPDRIVFNISRDRDQATNMPLPDDVMVSDDQGESFRLWTTVTELGGIAFSPEGEVWVGDSGDTKTPDAARGIKHAASLAEEPAVIVSDYPVNCLHHAGDALFVCKRFSLGRLSIRDGAFDTSLELSKVEAMNECEGVDTASVCRRQLCTFYCGATHFPTSPMCVEAYASTRDAGCAPLTPPALSAPPDAGLDSGMTADVSGSDGGCSCTAVGARHQERAGYTALGLLALALRRTLRRASS